MDIATLFGIFSAFGLVILAISFGSNISIFINLPSFMIVMGGTIGATMINYPLKDMLTSVNVLKNVLFCKPVSSEKIIEKFIEFASTARRNGILSLEASIENTNNDFIKKSLQLSVDGLDPQSIHTILHTEIALIKKRHQLGAEIFMTMGTFSPALGMIGTLIGLVQMLQSMSDPSTIGPAMAVALLTTFYGSILANLIFIPVSGKLRKRSQEETQIKEMITEGVISISKGENPRILEQKMLVFLPPKLRKSTYS